MIHYTITEGRRIIYKTSERSLYKCCRCSNHNLNIYIYWDSILIHSIEYYCIKCHRKIVGPLYVKKSIIQRIIDAEGGRFTNELEWMLNSGKSNSIISNERMIGEC